MTLELYILRDKKEIKGRNGMGMMQIDGMVNILLITYIAMGKGLIYWEINLEK